ncbi:MAG: XdhC/CoxI family protein, partial [Chloroflexi bacterium]|nr:XdhC/CoxI family protein [Chloroflexota bacterium]
VPIGAKMLVYEDRVLGAIGGGELESAVAVFARRSIPKHLVQTCAFTPDGERVEGRRAIEASGAIVEILVEVVEPASTLLVVGGGHVGLAVGQLGAMLGMEVAIIDDREDYANEERFPYEANVICGDFGEELERFPISANTYIVLVSRGHKVDELALRAVAERGAGYVGMIGSKRRTRTVLQHLAEEGIDPETLDKVFTPIGLDIGAETPEEIAVSVLGEIILVRRGGGAQPMSEHGRVLAAQQR